MAVKRSGGGTFFIFCLTAQLFICSTASLYAEDLIAISADIVEIGGSVERDLGVNWNDFVEIAEQSIPGIFRVGNFSRLNQLQSTIRALESEGKAQMLSNPKIVTKNGTSASFLVGGEMPIQIVGATGSVGVEFKKFGVLLNVLPVADKDRIDAQVQLEVSNPDFTKTVNGVPSIVTRQIQTEVDIKTGDTIVIGGLKRSEKQTSYRRVPILGHLPLIGALFTFKKDLKVESTLFLFVSFEILKT